MTQEHIPGFELAFLLIGSFRQMVDALHADLAEAGFPEARPNHGFTLQAIGPGAISITDLSRRLGVTKQAASKTVRHLEESGYVSRTPDPDDARATLIARSERGNALLQASAILFDKQRDRWRADLGDEHFNAAVAALRMMGGDTRITDIGGWLRDS